MADAQHSLTTRARLRLGSARTPGSLAARTRARRWQMLSASFPDLSEMRVLDLGGTHFTWRDAPVRPREVVLVNIQPQRSDFHWITTLVADACALPPEVTSQHFDLVYSSSVIEHVGGHARREAFAAAIRGSAKRYWVQTPYRYFPIEPHWLCPGFQFLPVATRAAVTRRWKLGHRRAPQHPVDVAVSKVLDVELLSKTEMQYYFPDAQILPERLLGLVKSLIAMKNS